MDKVGLKSLWRRAGSLLVAVTALLLLRCGEEGEFNPAAPEVRLIILTELAATPNLVSVSGGQAVLSGRVIDENDDPLTGAEVFFEANLGTITPEDTTTDADGRFSVDYRSGDEPGVDTVAVIVEDRSAVVLISVVGVTADMSLSVTSPSILANGMDTTCVIARLLDTEGSQSGVSVRFETTAGSFAGQRIAYANTDAGGQAEVLLTAPSSTATIVATVTATVEDSAAAISGLQVSDLGPRFMGFRNYESRIKRHISQRTAGMDIEASAFVTFRGVSVQVEASPALIPGDGRGTAEIRAVVKEENRQAVAGARVTFSAELGSIPGSAVTDESGVCTVTLTSADAPGVSDLIIAGYGPELADSVMVEYAEAVSVIEMSASPGSCLADGVSGTQVTATVLGGTGEPTAGIEVSFVSDAGLLSSDRAVTDQNGNATITLTGPAGLVDRAVTVWGEVSEEALGLGPQASGFRPRASGFRTLISVIGIQESLIRNQTSTPQRDRSVRAARTVVMPHLMSLSDSVTVIARGMQVRLTVNPDSIIARTDATAAVAVRVFETTSGNPVAGDVVRFSTTLGSIPGSQQLDADGRAQVTFRAGEETGLAEIVARYGPEHRDSAAVALLPTIGGLEVFADRPSMLAGGIDSALVTVFVTDALGGASPGARVQYENDFQPGVCRTWADENGQAQFIIVSPPVEVDTVLRVTVTTADLSEVLTIGLNSVTRIITVQEDSLSAGSQNPVEVTFQAYEAATRRPVTGDTIWFSAAWGVVQPWAVLDGSGFCRTSFLVGDEPATAWVYGRLGTLDLDSVRIELLDPVAKVGLNSGRSSILGDGLDTTVVIVQVTNIIDQPTPGVWVQFEAEGGYVTHAAAVTDEEGTALTTFRSVGGTENRQGVVRVTAFSPLTFTGMGEPVSTEIESEFLDTDPVQSGGIGSSINPDFRLRRKADRNVRATGGDIGRNADRSVRATGLSSRAIDPRFNRARPRYMAEIMQVVDSLTVELRGVTLEIRTNPRTIYADGRSKAGVNIQLAETTNRVAIAGATIRLGATLGAIRAAGITDAYGTLVDSLTAGIETGVSIVQAAYGEGIAAVDTVLFTHDPERLFVIFEIDPDEVQADGQSEVNLRARVVDVQGRAVEGIEVRFSVEGSVTVLVDADEHRNVTRWENTFRVEDPEGVDELRVQLQLLDVDSPDTRFLINRTPSGEVELPQGELWRDAFVTLPSDQLFGGVNRIEIVGGMEGDLADHFSVSGIRLATVGSHFIDETTTDEEGWAGAVLTADRTAASMMLKASLVVNPDRSAIEWLTLLPGEPSQLLIASVEDTLLASGFDQTEVLTLVTDEYGNPVGEDYLVTFDVDTAGSIEPAEARTLGDGSAGARFVSPVADEDVTSAVTAECEGAEGSWPIVLKATTLRLSDPPDRLLADGASRTNINATLRLAGGAPVEGRRIDFETTHGSITPFALTDDIGMATATLTAADSPDTAVITASFGPFISEETELAFAPVIGDVELSADPVSIRGDGIDSGVVTVTVTDGIGERAAGMKVDIETDQGRLSSDRVVTDNNGKGSVTLTGIPSVENDTVRVIASVVGHEMVDTLDVVLRGVTVTVEADADSLPANGVSTARVTARVRETTTGNPVAVGRVSFTADIGSITAAADIAENGVAEATYTVPQDTGTATIGVIYVEGLSAETEIILVDRAAALALEMSPQSILADGVQAADVVVRLTDPWGGPAPDELVAIDFDGPGVVEPNMGYTDADGTFEAVARGLASVSNGRLSIKVEVRDGRFSQVDTLKLRGVTFTVSASPEVIPGDGEATSTITAQARETVTGHAIIGDTVRFSSTAGVIAAMVRLDETGRAVTELISGREPAIATVAAIFGDQLTDTTQVAFSGRFSYLSSRIGREEMLADGVDTALIVATLRDTLGHPVEGTSIHFSVLDDMGVVSADSVATDGQGIATVTYRSTASDVDKQARVRAFVGGLSDTVATTLQGVTVSVSVEPDSLPANGLATAEVTVRVQTTGGNPIVGRTVLFAVSDGEIPISAELDDQGRATVTLTAAESPGEATISVRFGRTLTAEADIVYVEPIGSLTVGVERERLLGDGLECIQVTAQVLDELNDPAPGIRVDFSAPDGGRVEPETAETDDDGLAQVSFVGFASRADSVLSVEAEAAGGAGDAVDIQLLGIITVISSRPTELPANGIATAVVSLRASETTAHNPLSGHTVTFSADLGTINRSAELDTSGVARVIFTAPGEPGDATIGAVLGDTLLSILTLPCLLSQPENVMFSVVPRTVSVGGVGRNASATLTAEVTDDDGQPVPDGCRIILLVIPDIGVHFAGGADTLAVETEGGIIEATVTAGDETGTVNFEALFEGGLLATGGELIVLAGPPARITVTCDLGTIHHPAAGISAFPVAAIVADRFTNPVEDSTTVRFSVIPDTVAQITAVGYTIGGVVSTPVAPVDYPRGVWLTFDDDYAGEEVWLRASAGGGDAVDSARVILPGAVVGGEPVRMEVWTNTDAVPADGNSTVQVTVRLFDDEGQEVADMTEVTLTADLGSVQSPRYTAGGEVASLYRAGRVTGVDTIRIVSGAAQDSVLIRLNPGPPATIELTVENRELRANGVAATNVIALVRDRFENLVAPGTSVSFTTELGRITQVAMTDSSGEATARLTAGLETGVSLITASSGGASSQTSVRFVSGGPDGIVIVSINRDAIGVRGSGSVETATLVFEVRDDRGVPLDAQHPVLVDFNINGPSRVIDPAESSEDSVAFLKPAADSTDELGQVAVTLNSGYFAGAVEITASVGDTITGEAIAVAIHGGPPDEDHFTLITERCVLTGIYGTPVDTTVLTAAVGDRFSNPTVHGTVVRFSSTGGYIEGSARTDSLGLCSAILRTVNPWPVDGVDTITAQTVDWQNQEITTSNIVLVTGPTIISFDTTDGWQLPFGSFRDLSVTVADTFDHPLVAGTTVLIEITGLDAQGEDVEGLVLTGDATEDPYVAPECGQRSTFNVRVFNYVSGLDGALITLTVTVTSRNGDRVAELHGLALGQALSTSQSRVVLSPDEIIADGADESNINITLYDTLGIAIPGVPPDEVTVTVTGGEPLVTPPDAPSDDQGRMGALVVGRSIGLGTVEVRVDGQLLDDQPVLSFVPGPPARMTVAVLDRRLEVGGDTTSVVVDVTDENGNPTADGTSVTFDADDGSFNPVSTVTTGGRAISVFSSGIVAGPASFTVEASRRGGVVSEDIENLEFLPGPPDRITITAEDYTVLVGTQVEITVAGEDQFGNPVAENTQFTLSVDPLGNGSVAPTVAQADELGEAIVDFTTGTTAGDTAHVVAVSGGASGQSPVIVFLPGPPGRVTLSANPDLLEVGNNVQLTADVEDSYGNAVSDTTRVQFSVQPEGGTLTPSAVTTSGGTATSTLSGINQAGEVEAVAQAGEATGSVLITFTVGTLTSIQVTADPGSVQPGRSSTIQATAADRFGNPVEGAVLNFALTTNPGGNCSLQHNQRTTGADGTASTIFTAGDTSGSAIVTVSWDDDANVEGSTFVDIE